MYLLERFTKAEMSVPVAMTAPKYSLRLRLYAMLLMFDCLYIGTAFWAASSSVELQWRHWEGASLAAMVIPIYVGMGLNTNAYSLKTLASPAQAAVRAILFLLFAMLTVQCVLFFAHVSENFSRLSFGLGIALSAVALAASRHPFSRYALAKTGGALTDELVICDGIAMPVLPNANVLDAAAMGMRPDLNDPHMLNRLGRLLRTFDRVIIGCPPERRQAWSIVLRGVSVQGEIMLSDEGRSGAIGIGHYGHCDTHVVSKGPLSMASRLQKRAFDLAIAAPAIVLLSPLLLIVALAIKLESRGPILFMQDRIGQGNRIFSIAKFRSMRVETSDASGGLSASRIDDRITRVGRFIRKTSIDELPQLFNILIGDMSIVGPRPHALGSMADAKLFWEVNPNYWCRHALKPGMTGLAQVRGYRGATERAVDLENRLKADLEYLHDWSLLGEVLIVLRTFKVLIHRNAF